MIIASGCLVNVVLDIIFVAVLHMEALGCGIAVALTICSNATMIVLRMMRAPGAWRLSLSKLGIDRGICKSMISCGLPLGFQSAAYSISNVLIRCQSTRLVPMSLRHGVYPGAWMALFGW